MNETKPNPTKFVAAAVIVIVMAIVASRQLYLFAFRNADGLLNTQARSLHLWLAAGAVLTGLIAACLMFVFFRGRGNRSKYDELLTPIELPPNQAKISLEADKPANNLSSGSWLQQNEWYVEGAADDRRPVNGGVEASLGSASAQRSAARLNHQEMFRKWARERND